MKNKIVPIICISIIFNVLPLFGFDNFTNWGDAPSAITSGQDTTSGNAWNNMSWFEVGKNNGQPSSPTVPLIADEFKTLDSDKSEVIVSASFEFPQRIKPKQKLRISIGPKIPTAGISLKFALQSEKLPRNDFMTYRFEKGERSIHIKLNGKTIYHRNVTDVRVEQEVFLPFFYFEEENYLEFINEGNFPLAFDYFRLQPLMEGKNIFLVFDSSKKIPNAALKDFPIELIQLQAPTNILSNAVMLGNAQAPKNYEESLAGMNQIYSLGYLKDKKYGIEFNSWAEEISRVLKGKKLPYARINGDLTKVDNKTLMWFLTRFGCVVYGWICDNEQSAEVLSKYIDGANILALDVRDTDKIKVAANAPNMYTRIYSSPVSIKGGRQDRTYGEFILHYLSSGKNFSPAFVPYLTPLDKLVNQQAVIDNGEDSVIGILQVLMHGGYGAIIDPGEDSKNLILNGKKQPIWEMYKKVFELSNGEAKILPMTFSLATPIEGSPLEDTYYVATKNSNEEITIVVFSTRADYGRDASIAVPVEWSGTAAITQYDFEIDEIGIGVPSCEKKLNKNLKVLVPQKKKGVDIGDFKGVVSFEVKTSGLSVIKVQRYKGKNEQQSSSPSTANKKKTQVEKKPEHATSFEYLPNKWRYVPIVNSSNLVDFTEFAKNNISVLGVSGVELASAKASSHKSVACISAPDSFGKSGEKFTMLNAPIWDKNSFYFEFSSSKHKQRPSYMLNLGYDEYLKGASGFTFFVHATPIVGSISERVNTSSDPVLFSIGSRAKRLLFEAQIDKPTLIYVPYSSIMGIVKDPSIVYLSMNDKETRNIRLEINYLCAVHELNTHDPKLAVKFDVYEKLLYVLVEGDTGKPLNINFRLKDKFKLTNAASLMPHGFSNLKLNIDIEGNKYGIFIDKMPNNDGKKGDVSKYFDSILGEAPQGRTRVLIKFQAERY